MLKLFKKDRRTKEERFWDWFVKNKKGLEQFIMSDLTDYRLYNKLTKEIKKYNSLLFPEITMTRNNDFVLIITPDGMSEGVMPTKKLFEGKPEIDRWIVKKFRQPIDNAELNFKGIEFTQSDIKVGYFIDYDREKIDIEVYINGFDKKDSRFETLGWLYLDHVLGEYNTIAKVGAVCFREWTGLDNPKELLSLLQIRKLIDVELYKVNN